jgi:cytochrome oxidase Cu insertion factor (SCO1/SenC/PrrC family)
MRAIKCLQKCKSSAENKQWISILTFEHVTCTGTCAMTVASTRGSGCFLARTAGLQLY